jgi:hypothetical protein
MEAEFLPERSGSPRHFYLGDTGKRAAVSLILASEETWVVRTSETGKTE